MGISIKIKRILTGIVAIAAAFAVASASYLFIEKGMFPFVIAAFVSCGIVIWLAFPAKMLYLGSILLRFRWLVALAVFIICVLFNLHGSSIGQYDEYFPTVTSETEADNYHIYGINRRIRSDEWMIEEPLYFSQYYNGYGEYSRQMSVGESNMILSYYAPCWSLATIGKPFNWGYLLFGNAVGLSWYWCSLIILLFMTSFEMFMILTQKNVRISIIGMFMVGLAPSIQWWLLPHIPIVFVYAMGLFVIGYYFFTARKKWVKYLTTLLAGPAVIGFALSIFPSCQVMTALIVTAMLIACLIRDRSIITFNKRQWYRLAIPVVIAAGVLGSFILTNWSYLQTELNTVYPGKRISTGGNKTWQDLFPNLASLYLSYKNINFKNSSEVSTFIHFGPLFLALYPRIRMRLHREKDRTGIVGDVLAVILIIEIVFMLIGFPEILAKITLFSYVNRMQYVYGWTAVIFSVYSIYVIQKYPGMLRTWEKILYPLLYGFICVFLIDQNLLGYLPVICYIVEIAAFVIILGVMMFRKKRLFTTFTIGFMCAAGLMVNPISRGTSPITNHPISEFISSAVKEDPDAVWVGETLESTMSNFLLANGARTIDATNFLPDWEKWEILDPDHKYEDVYNRYGNQNLSIVDGVDSFSNPIDDQIHWDITPATLKNLNVRYVCSTRDITDQLSTYNIGCTKVFEQDRYMIFDLGK